MGFDEIRRFLYHLFQFPLCVLDLSDAQVQCPNLVADSWIAGANFESVFKKVQRVVVAVILLRQEPEIKVRVKVVGVYLQFLGIPGVPWRKLREQWAASD